MTIGPRLGNGAVASPVSECRLFLADDGSLTLTPTLGAAGHLAGDWYAGSMTETSTRASKRDVRPMGRARARRLLAVDPVTFQRVGDDDSAPREIGLIAEELEAAGLEELVGRDAAGEIAGIRYSRLVVMLLAIVRQQDERIQALEGTVVEGLGLNDLQPR